jgi:beta-mannosidase
MFIAGHGATQAQEVNRKSLNGAWLLSSVQSGNTYAAEVPGTVHTDLMNFGVIPDVYYRNYEQSFQYLEKQDWVYSRSFWMDKPSLTSEHIQLVCKGLDTYAAIKINGHELGTSTNMFRKWVFELKPYLKEGVNQLEIYFHSPFKWHKERVESMGYVFPADNEQGEYKYNPFCRKAAYHFGWDWGPRFVTAGIWQDIYLQSWNDILLEAYSCITLECDEDSATMLLKTIVNASQPAEITTTLAGLTEKQHRLDKGRNVLLDTFTIENPELWWPNGEGRPHLYTKTLTISSANGAVMKKNIRFGVRTITLVNEPDSIGTSFYFKVNGKPVFAKGANYIPQDVFLPRVKDKQYLDLLTAAKEANMNMIRVWGGGIYEKDIFYELCDSLGLMVWQDFMFAGTMYPIDDAFIEEVKAEAEYQINRLAKHPCIAIWCGNNEIDVAWHNWGWQKKYNYTNKLQKKLWSAYVKLFREKLPQWLQQHAPTIPYTSTSPLSNWGTADNFNHASMHYWGVWHGKDDISEYKNNVGRFMVEYGMQSYPEMSTILRFAIDEDLDLESAVMKNRQKSYIGNGEILKHTLQHFGKPKDFEDFVYKSQAVQALAYRTAIDAHRNSDGHCMGSLLWQLNDCWPAPSWSIIDYYGKPKQAYQAVKEGFE